jgi:large subunit ribosomal protein L5
MANEKKPKTEKTAKPDKADQGGKPSRRPPGYTPRLRKLYATEIRAKLKDELGLKNVMQVPRLKKIVLNMGVGEGSRDEKVLQQAEADLTAIAGLKPKRTNAKLSVAAFKLRKGMPVGCCVTLRGDYMYEFLERLINVAIPRIRDFRGMSPRSFDGFGGYNFGIREHAIFTEVDTSKVVNSFGMNVTLVTSGAQKQHCLALLKQFGFPFRES